jgi:ACS family allantoate permease-like MFS transporter
MADTVEMARQESHAAPVEKGVDVNGQASDEGYDMFAQSSDIFYTEEEAATVRRKLDWHLLPLMCFLYGICYVDKACLAWAVLFDFRSDLGLSGDQYNWGSSIFYFGYLVAQWPFNYALQKYHTGKILGYCVITWGILMIA